jgi:divalent metal cation (Fe/Co/Zn/Cd) transporter
LGCKGAIEAHDLRTWHAGRMTFIDFHFVVDGSTTVSTAHDICDRLEKAIKREIGESGLRFTSIPRQGQTF